MTSSFRFTLTSLDYDALVTEARRYAEINIPEWDFDNNSDIARHALDIYLRAKVHDIELFNGWSQEAFLTACRLRESAVAHSISRGYTPRNPTPSIGLQQLVVPSSPTPINIPQFAIRLSTRNRDKTNPIFFENASSFTIPAFTTLVEQEFVAGATTEQVYIGDGTPDQEFTLEESPVIDGSVIIVDDLFNDWTEVEDFVDSLSTDTVFQKRLLSDGRTQLIFGDDSNGASVPLGRVLSTTYRIGGGLNTNVLPDTIRTIEETPTSITSTNNEEKYSEGDDEESLASIKKNAPAAARQRRLLARVEEVKAFAESYAGVSRAFAQLLGTTVLVYIIPNDGGVPSGTLKTNLQAAIDDLLMMGYVSQVDDQIYVVPTIAVTFTTRKGYDSAEQENSIKLSILNYIRPTSYRTQEGRVVFLRQHGEPLRPNSIRAILQQYVDDFIIEPGFTVDTPAADVPLPASSIFTDIGATVTATSTNVTTVAYKT